MGGESGPPLPPEGLTPPCINTNTHLNPGEAHKPDTRTQTNRQTHRQRLLVLSRQHLAAPPPRRDNISIREQKSFSGPKAGAIGAVCVPAFPQTASGDGNPCKRPLLSTLQLSMCKTPVQSDKSADADLEDNFRWRSSDGSGRLGSMGRERHTRWQTCHKPMLARLLAWQQGRPGKGRGSKPAGNVARGLLPQTKVVEGITPREHEWSNRLATVTPGDQETMPD